MLWTDDIKHTAGLSWIREAHNRNKKPIKKDVLTDYCLIKKKMFVIPYV